MRRVALKIQRRRYANDAVDEVEIHDRIRLEGNPCAEIVLLREAFLYDEHVCMAFDRHGRSLERALSRGALSISRARGVTRQMLLALDRLHRCGFIHTDIKPDNILYDGRTGEARLADLGSATDRLRQGARQGSREYMAPEVLIGAPLSTALDMWSLGCTVFEMLTGRLLFSPRKVAARKYREFSGDGELVDIPRDERVAKDETEEAAEQFARGAVLAGRYKLERVLGQGRFGTVWAAQQINPTSPLLDSRDVLRAHAENLARKSEITDERAQSDRLWRRTKGADDLLDLAINYEHVLLIASLCGSFPTVLTQTVRYHASYFEEDGELRFRPIVRRVSLRERLRRQGNLGGEVLDLAVDFLKQLLCIDPGVRSSAQTALQHQWMQS